MDAALWPRVQESLKSYDVQSHRAVPIGPGSFRLEGAKRMYNVRVLPLSEAKVRMAIADHAAAGGCFRVERTLCNRFAQRVYPFDEFQGMTVSPHWSGEPLTVTPVDVCAAGATLARLHQALAAETLTLPEEQDVTVKTRYGTWKQSLERTMQLFQSEIPLSSTRLKQDQSARWRETLEGFAESAARALRDLEEAGYEDWSASARRSGAMAWNGLRLQQFTRLPSGAIAVAQSRLPVRDDALYDLACVAQEITENGHPQGVADLVSAYQAVRPLSSEEQRIVRAFAAFPHYGLRLIRAVQREPTGQFDARFDAASRQLAASNALHNKHSNNATK